MRKFKVITILSILILLGVVGYSTSKILPLEDSTPTLITSPKFTSEDSVIKPLAADLEQDKLLNYALFSTIDIYAFICLAGIYITLLRKGSKSRNSSF
ncbi:MAG: hypothetical protein RL662_858 [Bacteroidota bacterium]